MKTILNIKVDRELKEQVFKVAEDMSIPLSTLVNGMLRKLVEERTVTFTAPLRPSKRLIKILRQADKDIEAGKNLSPLFTDMKEMDEYLDNL